MTSEICRKGSESLVCPLVTLGVMKETFHFTTDNLTAIRKRRGIVPFNTGIVFEHTDPKYPPFILFWSFRFGTLRKALGELGFTVQET